MNITLKRTEEQVELIKAMASKNRDIAYEAQALLANFIGPVLAEVINNAPVLSNMFRPLQYNADDNPSLPLDLYYDITAEDYITVYSQSMPGGLPTNQVAPTAAELKVATYTLDSAVSFDRRYAAKSRLDVVGKTFTRMAQEILLKQEKTSANLVLGTLADRRNDGNVFQQISDNGGQFLLADLNKLLTASKRLHASWSGGTPDARHDGLNVLLLSPEVIEDMRGMAYNPIDTKASPSGAAGLAGYATDDIRNKLFNSSGEMPNFFGVQLHEIWQFGPGRQFTNIYNGLADTSVSDLVVALNTNRDSLLKVIATDSESGSEFSLMADDQYSIRQQKIGYYGSLEEGRVVLDSRVILGTELS